MLCCADRFAACSELPGVRGALETEEGGEGGKGKEKKKIEKRKEKKKEKRKRNLTLLRNYLLGRAAGLEPRHAARHGFNQSCGARRHLPSSPPHLHLPHILTSSSSPSSHPPLPPPVAAPAARPAPRGVCSLPSRPCPISF